jgi:hypothetical protein
MPARPALRALTWGATGAAVFLGCTLDWTVRPDDPVDGGSETGSADRGFDTPDSTDSSDSPTDTNPPDANECASLRANVEATRKAARACTFQVGECQLPRGAPPVTDECGCDVVVTRPTGTPTTNYQLAVAALKGSGCSLGCVACPSTAGRNCLSKNGGALTECYPP